MAAFLVDADMPARTAEALRSRGYDAVDARELGLISDDDIFRYAVDHQRAVISRDLGFGRLVTDSGSHPGLILLRLQAMRSPRIIDHLLDKLATLAGAGEDYSDSVTVIEPGRVRRRSTRR